METLIQVHWPAITTGKSMQAHRHTLMYRHIYRHIRTHTYMHAQTCMYGYTCTCAQTLTHGYVCIDIHAHIFTATQCMCHPHVCIHMYTFTCKHIHTCTHRHIQTCVHICCCGFVVEMNCQADWCQPLKYNPITKSIGKNFFGQTMPHKTSLGYFISYKGRFNQVGGWR